MIYLIIHTIRAAFQSNHSLILENIALRHQLQVLQRKKKHPRIKNRDRFLWLAIRRFLPAWRQSLFIVQPQTVVRWHRNGFRAYWKWKSRSRRRGRPKLSLEERELIHEMAKDNPTWGAPRIHGELLKLGIEMSPATVAKYMNRKGPPSQTWKTFLQNHAEDIVSIDFFTVPTVGYKILYVLLMIDNASRRVVHFSVTAHPTAEWTALQILQAFPWDTAPKFLLHDRDSIFGRVFSAQVQALGIEEVITAARSPWQNPYIERLIGTFRRDCTDYLIVLNERHLQRVLREYVEYYNENRTHLSLDKDCPIHRAVEHPRAGPIKKRSMVGGLHHRYYREAA